MDYHNTVNALRHSGRRLDLAALRDYLAEGRDLTEAFVYIGARPQPAEQAADQAMLRRLQQNGFLIRTRVGAVLPNGRLKCNLDLEMALDVADYVESVHPAIVVLVTGDGDFAPLVERLRRQGVRVEVASAPGCISAELRAWANGFIDLSQFGQEVEALVIPADMPLPAEAPELAEEEAAL